VLVDGDALGTVGRLKKWLIGLDGTSQSNKMAWFPQIVFFRRPWFGVLTFCRVTPAAKPNYGCLKFFQFIPYIIF
jgi:hypothetical protein